MAAPSDLRGMIKRKYDIQEQKANNEIMSAQIQADVGKYAADQAVKAAGLNAMRQPDMTVNNYLPKEPDNSFSLPKFNFDDLGFADGTERVPATGRAIMNPVTPPAPPPAPKPMQGPKTLSETAKGTTAEPFAKGVDTIDSAYHTLDTWARKLGFACGTERVHAQQGLAKVPGSGPSNVDSVPAMLAPNEAVLNAPAADMVGRGLIKALNRVGVQKMGMR